METLVKTQVGQLVAKDYRTAAVFSKYGIDFCCNGNISLEDVCNKKKIEIKDLLENLNTVVSSRNDRTVSDYNSWPLDLLADYIEKIHHTYVQEKIPVLNQFLAKLCAVHGERHPELFEINELFTDVAIELTNHMKKEEMVLFPFVRKMVRSSKGNNKIASPNFGALENPISVMEHEHDNAGEIFRKIYTLTNNYKTPPDGCTTYRVAFSLLKEFEEDLHLHIHLENNILFPKALKLEKRIVGNSEASAFSKE